jgi:hypothetical protein
MHACMYVCMFVFIYLKDGIVNCKKEKLWYTHNTNLHFEHFNVPIDIINKRWNKLCIHMAGDVLGVYRAKNFKVCFSLFSLYWCRLWEFAFKILFPALSLPFAFFWYFTPENFSPTTWCTKNRVWLVCLCKAAPKNRWLNKKMCKVKQVENFSRIPAQIGIQFYGVWFVIWTNFHYSNQKNTSLCRYGLLI